MKAGHLKSCGTNSDLGFLTIKKYKYQPFVSNQLK